jgi:hypothetical protein
MSLSMLGDMMQKNNWGWPCMQHLKASQRAMQTNAADKRSTFRAIYYFSHEIKYN